MRNWWMGLRLAMALCCVTWLAGCGGGGDVPAAPGADAVLKATTTSFTQHGVWWNAAEPGSGFFFEAQGDTGVATFYLYDADGRAVWYASAGALTLGSAGYRYAGPLQRYTGGQPGHSLTYTAPTSTVVGSVTIAFDAGTKSAQVQLPGRSFRATRFYGATAQGATQQQPETGIYWNPAQSGRGFTVEVANGMATVAVFHYTDDGQPTWNLVTAPLTGETAQNASGDFVRYGGGQTLSGAYRAPTSSTVQGSFKLSFTEPCKGQLAFPGMPMIDVQRFAFGGLPAGKECRTYPLIPAVVSPPIVPTTIFSDVVLKLTSTPMMGYSVPLNGKLNPGFTFSATGNFASLNGRVIYVVVVDPHGFYQPGSAQVNLYTNSPGAQVLLTPKPITKAGDYKGELLFYACLDPACSTQFVGSPFKLPYSIFVR